MIPPLAETLALKSIDEEAADCLAAWATVPDATAGLHIHHETVAEPLTEPIVPRIAYILGEKPREERALRLRLMRPLTAAAYADYDAKLAPLVADYDAKLAPLYADLHQHCIEGCPWDGQTIFPAGGGR